MIQAIFLVLAIVITVLLTSLTIQVKRLRKDLEELRKSLMTSSNNMKSELLSSLHQMLLRMARRKRGVGPGGEILRCVDRSVAYRHYARLQHCHN